MSLIFHIFPEHESVKYSLQAECWKQTSRMVTEINHS